MIDARLLGKVYIAMTRGQVAMSIPTGVASVAMEAGGDVPVRLATQSEKAAHEKTLDMMEEINNEKPLCVVSALAFCRDRRFVHGWRGAAWRLSADIKLAAAIRVFIRRWANKRVY